MENLHSEWTDGVKAVEECKASEGKKEERFEKENRGKNTEKSKFQNIAQEKNVYSEWTDEVETPDDQLKGKSSTKKSKSANERQKRHSYLERAFKNPPKKKVEIAEPPKVTDDIDQNPEKEDQIENPEDSNKNKKEEYRVEEHHNLSEETQGHVVNIVAGSLSGIISTALALPLERLKLESQSLLNTKIRRSLWQEARVLYAEKGVAGFWKGHTRAQVLGVCHNIIIFWTYEQVTKVLDKIPAMDNYDMLKDFTAGFCSGASTAFIVSPVDQIMTRIITVIRLKQRFRRVDLRPLLKVDALHMFQRGVVPDVLQHSCNYGYKFLFYNMLCEHVFAKTVDQEREDIPSERLLLAGATAGFLAHNLTYPFEILRRRLQLHTLKRQGFHFDHTCRKLLQCLFLVVRTDGFLGLYRGILPVLIKATVNTSVMFAVFDKMHKTMEKEI